MDFRHWQAAKYDNVICSVICMLGMLDNVRSSSTVHPACTLSIYNTQSTPGVTEADNVEQSLGSKQHW